MSCWGRCGAVLEEFAAQAPEPVLAGRERKRH